MPKSASSPTKRGVRENLECFGTVKFLSFFMFDSICSDPVQLERSLGTGPGPEQVMGSCPEQLQNSSKTIYPLVSHMHISESSLRGIRTSMDA